MPFCVTSDTFATQKPIDAIVSQLSGATPRGENASFWKCFVVYVCGQGYSAAEGTIKELQKLHPDAAIIGGICHEGRAQGGTFSQAEPARDPQQCRWRARGEGEPYSSSSVTEDIELQIAEMTVRQLKREIVDTFGRDALVRISEKGSSRAKAKASIVRKRAGAGKG